MSIPRIAVVGSYATGLTMKVKHLPRSGETLLGAGYRVDFGGKGSNQAVGCARLGASVQFIASIGGDSFGEMALALYREEGIDTGHVKKSGQAPTGVGFIVVEEETGNNCIVLDPGANELLAPADVRGGLEPAAVVLTQLEIPAESAEAALVHGRTMGSTTILNPAPVRPLQAKMFQSADVLTPNETEARVLAGYDAGSTVDVEAVGRELIARGAKHVVITLGEKGALIVHSDSCSFVPAVRVRAIDTTGAGDAFNAGLATALARGTELEEAVHFAVVIGAMAVMREGVIPSLPRRAEVLDFYLQRSMKVPSWLAKQG